MRAILVVLLVVVVGCDSKKNESKPGANPTAKPTTGGGGRGGGGYKLPGSIDEVEGAAMCATLVPEVARAGATLSGGGFDGILTCNFNVGKKLIGSASIDCSRGKSLDDFNREKTARKATDSPGLGRSAYATSTGPTFFASQADCVVSITAFETDLSPAAKAIDGTLTATTAPKPAPAAAGETTVGLRCDDITKAARERAGTPERVEQTVVLSKLTCQYKGPKQQMWVHLQCPRDGKKQLESSRESQKGMGRFIRDVDVGGGGFEESGHQVSFLDPQTKCVADVATLGTDEVDPVALAKDLEAAITAETIK